MTYKYSLESLDANIKMLKMIRSVNSGYTRLSAILQYNSLVY